MLLCMQSIRVTDRYFVTDETLNDVLLTGQRNVPVIVLHTENDMHKYH